MVANFEVVLVEPDDHDLARVRPASLRVQAEVESHTGDCCASVNLEASDRTVRHRQSIACAAPGPGLLRIRPE